MKKALVGLTSVSMLLMTAAPVLAMGWFGASQEVIGNTAFVNTTANSSASSGSNAINSFGGGVNTIVSGDAYSYAESSAIVNSNVSGCCGFGGEQEVIGNMAGVNTTADSSAKSGANKIDSSSFGGGSWNLIASGDAGSVALAQSEVNSNESSCCGFGGEQEVIWNSAFVNTGADSSASSGANKIDSFSFCGGGFNTIITGYAGSEDSAFSIVNSNIKRGL